MGAGFSRIKQWVDQEILTDTDLNGEFDNILNNVAVANGIASLSAGTKVVEDPANATVTPTASKIPIADSSGKLDISWLNEPIDTFTTTDTLAAVHTTCLFNHAATPFTLTLPTIGDVSSATYQKVYRFRNINDAVGTIGGTVDGVVNPTLANGESVEIYGDGTTWRAFFDSTIYNTLIPIRDFSRGLVLVANTTNPAYQVDIDADEIALHDSTPHYFRDTSVNVTVDITASGANGLDTGSEAASTNYYIWVIYDAVGTTTAGMLSLSKTAPTMPGDYTFKALVGELFNDSGSDISYINWWNGTYFLDGEAADVATNGPTSLDLGTVTIGDVWVVNASIAAGSGISAGTSRLYVSKASGTATIEMHDGSPAATQTAYIDTIAQAISISAVVRVATSGTFVLASALLVDGGGLTGYGNEIYIKFMKKQ